MNKTEKSGRFWKGLLIYILVMLLLIFVGFFLFWKFIAAYELSRTDGVIDRYLDGPVQSDLQTAIQDYAQKYASDFQSSQEIADQLNQILTGQELTYRKAVGEFTQTLPVYTLRFQKAEIGKARLTIGEPRALNFGFDTWELLPVSYDFSPLGETITVTAPATVVTDTGETDLTVTLNGAPLTRTQVVSEGTIPALEPYQDALPDLPPVLTYRVEPFFGEPVVDILNDGITFCIEQDESTFSITQECPEALAEQLTDYAQDFVQAYIAFTSNAVTGSGAVQSYMIPGSELYQRMYAAMDGLSWVHGVTSTMSDLTVDNLQYFGNVALCDAQYVLTQNGTPTDNQMHIVLADTDSGWRVAEIAMY